MVEVVLLLVMWFVALMLQELWLMGHQLQAHQQLLLLLVCPAFVLCHPPPPHPNQTLCMSNQTPISHQAVVSLMVQCLKLVHALQGLPSGSLLRLLHMMLRWVQG